MAAPNLSASFSIKAKFSPEPIPRPPEITISADVSSGRSDLESSADLNEERPVSEPDVTSSIEAEPVSATLSKAVPRTVMTFLSSLLSTTARALPA